MSEGNGFDHVRTTPLDQDPATDWPAFVQECKREFAARHGLSWDDLPDTIALSDYWYEGMSLEDFQNEVQEAVGMLEYDNGLGGGGE